jgi:ATPase family associated with various cellular activities (AAA)
MSIHKLNTEQGSNGVAPLNVGLSFQHDLYDLADSVIKTRAMRMLESGVSRYAIHRSVRCAARRTLEQIFDDLALSMGLQALRLDEGSLLLDGSGVFIRAEGRRKSDYSSCSFDVWSDSVARAETTRKKLFEIVGEQINRDNMFTIDWHFMNARSGLVSASFDEVAGEPIHDEAYPALGVPVATFAEKYLSAAETVLVLQGPPGTGKTRLVRAILSAMSKRKGESAQVMYTADKRALENDEIFVDFITGSHDAFVVEDADHLLTARSSGNQDLHRFLAIADGVVRAQGRKIIFTTNLPNITDIDDALLRPGRCFASIRIGLLSKEQARGLIDRLRTDPERNDEAIDRLFPSDVRSVSVASVYQQLNR